ncbi:MAG: TrmB family transcriptional regulator [Fidelibacterota bacterium]
MPTERAIIDILGDLGLSVNAAKAYLALLKKNPATGYEISADSGIPRSAIYSVLNKLKVTNMVNEIGTGPRKFVPLAPSSLLEHLARVNEERIDSLKSAFDSLDIDEEAFDFWHLHGYKNLILKMREGIRGAEEKVFTSLWNREYSEVVGELKNAADRGIEVVVFSFSKLEQPIGKVISYSLEEKELRRFWNPKVIMVVDLKTAIMGSASTKQNNRAIWTNNEAITEIAMNHMILDITLAGQRLGIEVNPIVQKMMKWSDFHLEEMIKKHHNSSS